MQNGTKMKKEPITIEGLEKLKKELEELKNLKSYFFGMQMVCK